MSSSPRRPGLLALLLTPILFAFGTSVASAGTIEISFDIKPTSCPNPFNPDEVLRAPTFPSAILGGADLDVSAISPSSLVIVVPGGGGRLGEITIPPTSTNIEDVATPVLDNAMCACTTDGPDGFDDLTIHFDQQTVSDALVNAVPGAEFQLCIRGELIDGTPFEGCDCIFIVGPVSLDADTWGQVKATYR